MGEEAIKNANERERKRHLLGTSKPLYLKFGLDIYVCFIKLD